MDQKDSEAATGKGIEAEIRRERKFSLAEAVGREAAGSLSGASPVAPAKQVLLEIEHLLEVHLPDPAGSLTRTLLANLEQDLPLLGRHFADPAGALKKFLAVHLESGSRLNALVRETDARWGRDYQERPHFESDDHPPHPDDPYTRAGVRDLFVDLLENLTRD